MKTLVLLATLLASTLTNAAENQTTTSLKDAQNNRTEKQIGVYLSLFGDPAPSIVGVNVAYNINSFLRGHAGYGEVSTTNLVTNQESSMTTLGAGVDALWPAWNLSPIVGLSYSHVWLRGGSFDVSDDNLNMKLGIEWQSPGGFMIGTGTHVALAGDASGTYINSGWFF